MGLPLRKWENSESFSREFAFSSLVTRVLIEAFCPVLKSEIVFGEIEKLNPETKFPLWIDAEIRGDFTGRLGLGADQHVLKSIASHLGWSKAETDKALIFIHESLAKSLEVQFQNEDFKCRLHKGSGLTKDYQIPETDESNFICNVETRWGVLQVLFALKPTADEVLNEMATFHKSTETRKIRVYSSQLESLNQGMKQLERLETRLLQGPHVRSQMRGQIKRLKRMINHLKSEPLDTLFSPAKKAALELARSQGKQLRFQSHGTWLFLEKNLLNYLYEPILHIVRNAVDHGLEEPLERERVGKSSVGTIKAFAAFNQGVLRILISDDGRGLDFGAIRERAVAKGILTAETAVEKTQDELAKLVFQPGFSTRAEPTLVSGRGIGLDVVTRNILAVDGTFRLVSTSAHGTSFEILLPLNEDFGTTKMMQLLSSLAPTEENEDHAVFEEELWAYFDRLAGNLRALSAEPSLQGATEAYRLSHSIKGTCSVLGWTRAASFAHHFEDFLKILSEGKLELNDVVIDLSLEAAVVLKEFCEAAQKGQNFSLYRVRRVESRLLQVIWSKTKSDETTQLFLGKYHLNSVENHLLHLAKEGSFSVRPEADFSKALSLPLGALIQFNGDRRGFAGIFLSEETFTEIIQPSISGVRKAQAKSQQLTTLTEFANLMGHQFAEACAKSGITLQPSAPLTYEGQGEPMRFLGNPTYCYHCELNGKSFYLAGDFKAAQEISDHMSLPEKTYPPQVILDGIKECSEKLFATQELKVLFSETPTQSDLIGLDTGATAILGLRSDDPESPQCTVFLSFENSLYRGLTVGEGATDPLDSVTGLATLVGQAVAASLERNKLKFTPSEPSVFLGKAYVANFNRLFVTNKAIGTTENGKIEIQVLVTDSIDKDH